jgi:hypothetical protein
MSRLEDLVERTDALTDDEVADAVEKHQDGGLFLALLRRVQGERVKPEEAKPEDEESKPEEGTDFRGPKPVPATWTAKPVA